MCSFFWGDTYIYINNYGYASSPHLKVLSHILIQLPPRSLRGGPKSKKFQTLLEVIQHAIQRLQVGNFERPPPKKSGSIHTGKPKMEPKLQLFFYLAEGSRRKKCEAKSNVKLFFFGLTLFRMKFQTWTKPPPKYHQTTNTNHHQTTMNHQFSSTLPNYHHQTTTNHHPIYQPRCYNS